MTGSRLTLRARQHLKFRPPAVLQLKFRFEEDLTEDNKWGRWLRSVGLCDFPLKGKSIEA